MIPPKPQHSQRYLDACDALDTFRRNNPFPTFSGGDACGCGPWPAVHGKEGPPTEKQALYIARMEAHAPIEADWRARSEPVHAEWHAAALADPLNQWERDREKDVCECGHTRQKHERWCWSCMTSTNLDSGVHKHKFKLRTDVDSEQLDLFAVSA